MLISHSITLEKPLQKRLGLRVDHGNDCAKTFFENINYELFETRNATYKFPIQNTKQVCIYGRRTK